MQETKFVCRDKIYVDKQVISYILILHVFTKFSKKLYEYDHRDKPSKLTPVPLILITRNHVVRRRYDPGGAFAPVTRDHRLWPINAIVVRETRLNRHVIFNDPCTVVKACHCNFSSCYRNIRRDNLRKLTLTKPLFSSTSPNAFEYSTIRLMKYKCEKGLWVCAWERKGDARSRWGCPTAVLINYYIRLVSSV